MTSLVLWWDISTLAFQQLLQLSPMEICNPLILTGGRMNADSYFHTINLLRLHQIQQPLKFSLVNSNLICTADMDKVFPDGIKPTFQLLSEELRDVPVPEWSFLCLPHEMLYGIINLNPEQILSRQVLQTFKKLLFPCTITQIEWLQSCLKTVQNLKNEFFGREFGGDLSEFWLVTGTHQSHAAQMSQMSVVTVHFRFYF